MCVTVIETVQKTVFLNHRMKEVDYSRIINSVRIIIFSKCYNFLKAAVNEKLV